MMKYTVLNFILTKYSTVSKIFCENFKEIANMEEFKDNCDITFKTIDVEDLDYADIVDELKLKFVPTVVIKDKNNNTIETFIGAATKNEIINKLKELIKK